MSKHLENYFEKKKDKSYLNCKIDKDIYDKMSTYKDKLDKSWPDLIEALFLRELDEENKRKQK